MESREMPVHLEHVVGNINTYQLVKSVWQEVGSLKPYQSNFGGITFLSVNQFVLTGGGWGEARDVRWP